MAAAQPAPAATSPAIQLKPAELGDVPQLFTIINDSYEVETGDSGVAFKKTPRLLDTKEVEGWITAGRCIKAVQKEEEGGEAVLGCIVWDLLDDEGGKRMYFGPLAVAPKGQGKGVGNLLRIWVEEHGRSLGLPCVEITVVNLRTDVLPWYSRHGYKEVGTGPFPAPERLTRDCHFIVMQKPLKE